MKNVYNEDQLRTKILLIISFIIVPFLLLFILFCILVTPPGIPLQWLIQSKDS